MTVGFLNAGVPFGSTMSFLIASPLLNPIIIGMLGAMVGIKAMVAYFVIAFLCSVLFGFIMGKMGMQKYVKNVRLKTTTCCSAGGHENLNKRSLPFKMKIKLAFSSAWESLRPIMGYLLIGEVLSRHIRLYAAGFRNENCRTGQSVCHSYRCRFGHSSVYSCRDCNPNRISSNGQGHEYRCCYLAHYWRCRYGHTRNDHAGKYIQEKNLSL